MIPLIIMLILIPNIIVAGVVSEYSEKICSPTEITPYYNCDEPTFLVLWDVQIPPRYNWNNDIFYFHDNSTYLASTVYNIPHEPTVADNFTMYNVIILGNTHSEMNVGEYDEPGVTPLAHEIRHVKCKCTWHPEG